MSKRSSTPRKGKTLEQKIAELDRKKQALTLRQEISNIKAKIKALK